MCGIFGAVSLTGRELGEAGVVERMGRAIAHRGPDKHGVYSSPHGVLGTERLRIIDLDPRADQPFAAPDGTWLVCNGEIYNYRTLRREYADYPYRSLSDVETILPMYQRRGPAAIEELDGMFGLAIWDPRKRELVLARDRAGEKPLFYTRIDDEVWFASEIQALLEHPRISRAVDRDAAAEFLTHGYIVEPRTIFRSIRRVGSGTYRRFTADGETETRYWRPEEIAVRPIDPGEAVRELKNLLRAAVQKQLVADVPVGVFVSGGLDSALLLHLAAHETGHEHMQSFSVRFVAESYDESHNAARVSALYGSRHHFITADEPALMKAFAEVTSRIAEPIADPAVLPTVLLARLARQYVTVTLGGEGADELFGGYPTVLGHTVAPYFANLPGPLQEGIRSLVRRLPTSRRKVTLEFLLKRFVATAGLPWIERHASWFGTSLPDEAFASEHRASSYRDEVPNELDALHGAMLLDYRTYLRDNLLVKIDRATMLSSLEGRTPYLDRDVTRFAFSLPSSLKVRRFNTKWIIKQVAADWLPDDIVNQRKRGLSVPIADWINGGLRSEVDRLLAPERLRSEGIVKPEMMHRMLDEHRGGKANHARALWPLIVLQRWAEEWKLNV
jgi:asparagine synthase (glutamine-hydrolysing)